VRIEHDRVHNGFVHSRVVARGAVSFLVVVVAAALFSFAPSTSRAATSEVFSPRLLAPVPHSKTVYLVTQGACGTKRCLTMWRSTDGGRSFARRSVPLIRATNGDPASSLDQLVFANERDGYLAVGPSAFALYATTNGARSWHEVALPRKNWHDLVVTPDVLYITTDRCRDHFVICGDYRVWRSSTDGKRWSALPALWRTGTAKNESYYGPSVAAYGNEVWELESAYMATYLWRSSNDGRTFTRYVTPRLGSVAGCTVTPLSAFDLWADCPTGMQVSFVHSSDGGATWSSISQHQFFGTVGGAFAPVTNTVAYLDYGVDSGTPNLYRLTEGGRRATPVGDLQCSQASLAFSSVADGLAICTRDYNRFLLVRTTDGGAQWSNEVLWGS